MQFKFTMWVTRESENFLNLCEAKYPIVIPAFAMIVAPFGFSHQVMILFGGEQEGQTLNDLWRFHFGKKV